MDDIVGDILNDPAVSALGLAIGVAVVALWLAAAWWAYTDATRRTDSAFTPLLAAGWIIFSTPLMLPMALAVYALARPQQSAAEQRGRRLAADLVDEMYLAPELDACAGCGSPADPAWLRCPTCTTWLAAPCASCGSWSDRTLAVCPWCGSEERGEPTVEHAAPLPTEPGLRGRRIRRPTRAVGPGRSRVHRPTAVTRRAEAPDSRPVVPVGRR